MGSVLSERPGSGIGQQQYTTVGSVWQPQSLPMQPPVRRGRTVKSEIPGMPIAGSYETSSPHYYSPLQQNFDRAVSPAQTPSPYLRLDLLPQVRSEADVEEAGPKGAIMSRSGASFVPYPSPGFPDKQVNENQKPGEDRQSNQNTDYQDEDEEQNTLIRMSTKTLTNLASYPNPMQKGAQKILTKARQAPPSNMQHHASGSSNENGGSVPPYSLGSRSVRSDSVATENVFQSDRTDEYRLRNQLLKPNYLNTAASDTREHDTYPAVLSRGPGAPRPLTAGPPGQRHFQPSAYPPMNGSQKNIEYGPFDDGPYRFPSSPAFQSPQHAYPFPQQPFVPYVSEGQNDKSKIIDTLTAEEARRFYRYGQLPSNFNYDTEPLPDDWAEQRLREVAAANGDPYLLQQSYAYEKTHKDKVNQDFYAGKNLISKDLFDAIEKEGQGSTPDTSKPLINARADGKVDKKFIPIIKANEIPTHEHAAPLLALLYRTLADRPGNPSRSKPSEYNTSR
ncbi:hypothetical protein GGR54DRAFT_647460 [Hypoxylon sp. NC1633]|nr:hypothetical protein GGR54DRAFT_647460 [Hypoxylon sp. NC1633]